jgi:hypothetical protein
LFFFFLVFSTGLSSSSSLWLFGEKSKKMTEQVLCFVICEQWPGAVMRGFKRGIHTQGEASGITFMKLRRLLPVTRGGSSIHTPSAVVSVATVFRFLFLLLLLLLGSLATADTFSSVDGMGDHVPLRE